MESIKQSFILFWIHETLKTSNLIGVTEQVFNTDYLYKELI